MLGVGPVNDFQTSSWEASFLMLKIGVNFINFYIMAVTLKSFCLAREENKKMRGGLVLVDK